MLMIFISKCVFVCVRDINYARHIYICSIIYFEVHINLVCVNVE
jgi:hypothetical protein